MNVLLCITGASGVGYGMRLAQVLKESSDHMNIHLNIVVSKAAEVVFEDEYAGGWEAAKKLLVGLGKVYDNNFIAAPIASGSRAPDVVVVCPCSMKTLSALANGYSNDLITRATDVALKEGKKVILVPRETPLTIIHVRNMLKVIEAGAILLPASPAFYHSPKQVDDMVNFIVGKVLDIMGISHNLYKRWKDET